MLIVSNDEEHLEHLVRRFDGTAAELVVADSIANGWQCFNPLTMDGVMLDVWLPDGCGVELYVWMTERAPWVHTQFMLGDGEVFPAYVQTSGNRIFIDRAALSEIASRTPVVVFSQRILSPEHLASELGWTVEEAAKHMAGITKKLGASTFKEAISFAITGIEQRVRDDFLEGTVGRAGESWDLH